MWHRRNNVAAYACVLSETFSLLEDISNKGHFDVVFCQPYALGEKMCSNGHKQNVFIPREFDTSWFGVAAHNGIGS